MTTEQLSTSYWSKVGSFATGLTCGFLSIPLGRFIVLKVQEIIKPEPLPPKYPTNAIDLWPTVRALAPAISAATYALSVQLVFYHDKSKTDVHQDKKPFVAGALVAGSWITAFRVATEVAHPIGYLYPRFWFAVAGLVLRDSLAIYPFGPLDFKKFD